MAIRTFITPTTGSGAVNLRSADKIDPATIVGLIKEGTLVEYFSQTGSWYVGKVYVSTQGAEVVDHRFIKPKASNDFVNLRSSPVVENNTDVGDLKQGQQLELIATMGEWLVGKVYLSAPWCELVTEGQPDLPMAIADGFDAPIGSPQERAGAPVWPGAWFDATPFGARYDATDEGRGFGRACLDDHCVRLEVGDLLGLGPVGGLRGGNVDALQDLDAKDPSGLLGRVGRELESPRPGSRRSRSC